jgi:hypothetical protein
MQKNRGGSGGGAQAPRGGSKRAATFEKDLRCATAAPLWGERGAVQSAKATSKSLSAKSSKAPSSVEYGRKRAGGV